MKFRSLAVGVGPPLKLPSSMRFAEACELAAAKTAALTRAAPTNVRIDIMGNTHLNLGPSSLSLAFLRCGRIPDRAQVVNGVDARVLEYASFPSRLACQGSRRQSKA